MDILFRHREPRKYQREMMEEILRALDQGRNVMVQAPTGIGKTDGALSPSITYALEHGYKVLYVTPKISQHILPLSVVRDLEKKYRLSIGATDFVGKRYMCIDPLLSRADPEDFYEICRKKREKEDCLFYKAYFDGEVMEKVRKELSRALDHMEVKELGAKYGVCPYELLYEKAKKSTLVVCDYYHLFSPKIRKVFLQKTGTILSRAIVIVEEAHNLPERVRKLLSATVTTGILDRAERELEYLGEDREAVHRIKEILDGLPEKESVVDIDLEEELGDLSSLSEELYDLGRVYLEESGKSKSTLLRVARFLERWKDAGEGFVKIGERGRLRVRALDPSLVTREVMESAHSVILMSATLSPMEMYRDILGVPDPVMLSYPSPFPRENRLVLIVPSVTTRYSRRTPEEYSKIREILEKTVGAIPGNTAVFFPSYEVMEAVTMGFKTDKKVYVQRERMRSEEARMLLSAFKKDGNGLLFGVAGGSFSEGVDYPGEELVGVVVVGIPLAEMTLETRALIDYYEEKFGRGWYYGYIFPAMVRAVQAAGRVIRGPEDRGVVVLMDERYLWKNYRRCLPRDWPVITTSRPWEFISHFFKGRKGS